MNDIGNNILKSLNAILDEQLKKLKYDKTFKSTIWGKNEDGTYQISYKNQLYNVYNALGTDLELGQSVWIKIPGGIFRNMHICGCSLSYTKCIQNLLNKYDEKKVDKVAGKGLSTNDYTTAEKNKLKNIASGAEVNVQSDWNINDSSDDAYIKNKPAALPASDVFDWAKKKTKPTYTKQEVGLGNVDNKNSETIRSEITKKNVTDALGYTPPVTDTTNTTGATNNTEKLFLIGAISQSESLRTYSNNSNYIGKDGCLYSNNIRIISELIQESEPTSQKDGDYWMCEY